MLIINAMLRDNKIFDNTIIMQFVESVSSFQTVAEINKVKCDEDM